MADRPVLHGLLLAAGGSARFDGIKQLALFRDKSLLHRAASAAAQVLGSRVTVVLGAHADRLIGELDGLDVTSIVNTDWRRGMGSSLNAGIAALPADAGAALVMLCDQPFVDADVLRRLVVHWRREPHRLIASEYEMTLGVPAIIPRAFFADIDALADDRGAKLMIARYRDEVIRVPVPEAAVDVDTTSTLAVLECSQPTQPDSPSA